MSTHSLKVDHTRQYELLNDNPPTTPRIRHTTSASGRTFIAYDRHDLYLGMTRLDRYLQDADQRAPLFIAELLEQLDWRGFEQRYAPSGRAPYAPSAMMGLILYGISQGTSSLRGLEKLGRLDLGARWISSGISPDHAAIGRFILLHDEALSGAFFDDLTRQVLRITGSDGLRVAGDGSVIEAACSHYRLLREDAVRQQAQAAREALRMALSPAQQTRAQRALAVEHTFNARQQARRRKGNTNQRLVVSPTEPDAMVQPQKRQRGISAAYRPILLTNDRRVILAQTVDPSQETAVIPRLFDQCQRLTGEQPREALFDALYFTTPVIDASLARDISLLCPEGQQAGSARASQVFPKSAFDYQAEDDVYHCPAGEILRPGPPHNPAYRLYRTRACGQCALRAHCTRAAAGRRLRRLPGDEAKEALRQVMQHPQAQAIYRQRQAMVEPVFRALKCVQGLTRFRRRGLAGVKREFALHALAHNLCAEMFVEGVEGGVWIEMNKATRSKLHVAQWGWC